MRSCVLHYGTNYDELVFAMNMAVKFRDVEIPEEVYRTSRVPHCSRFLNFGFVIVRFPSSCETVVYHNLS
jgi:hypothetical protein